MTLTIESKVRRGALQGEQQSPWQDKDGYFVASSARFEKNYIRVADIESLANALVAGLSIRMKSEGQKAAGLVAPESITIDGLSVDAWQLARK